MRSPAVALLVLLGCQRPLDRAVAYEGVRAADPGPIEDVPVRGFEATVFTATDRTKGELIAVDEKAVYLRTEKKTIAFPVGTIDHVSVLLDSNKAMAIALGIWGAVGTASTLSHGLYLLFSAPTWAVITSGTVTNLAYPMITDARHADLPRLYQFARFPQGLPPGL